MSTEILEEFGPHRLTLTQFSGGDRGGCIQITGVNRNMNRKHEPEFGAVGLTVDEARTIGAALITWANSVTKRETK